MTKWLQLWWLLIWLLKSVDWLTFTKIIASREKGHRIAFLPLSMGVAELILGDSIRQLCELLQA